MVHREKIATYEPKHIELSEQIITLISHMYSTSAFSHAAHLSFAHLQNPNNNNNGEGRTKARIWACAVFLLCLHAVPLPVILCCYLSVIWDKRLRFLFIYLLLKRYLGFVFFISCPSLFFDGMGLMSLIFLWILGSFPLVCLKKRRLSECIFFFFRFWFFYF